MPHDHEDHHAHDLGFAHDLPRMIGRRRLLALMGGFGVFGLAAGPAAALECVALPRETAGPYPADGSNVKDGQVVNALTQDGVIRTDLRTSFGTLTPTADGLQLDLELTLVNADGCTPLEGHAIYLWHCDTTGNYSLYDITDANYLRGVGVADAEGKVRFTTIFPGCYDGRWPHFHFEIFESVQAAVNGDASVLTAQIALPEADCADVYASADLRPVLSSWPGIEQWATARESGIATKAALHVDTGMNRLGLTVEEALAFRKRNMAEHLVSPVMIMSHLACADDPDHPLNRRQLESFQQVAAVFDDIDSSFANSAGIFLGTDFTFDLTRPGIALYGGCASVEGKTPMRPVVSLDARIVQVRKAPKGETVSYGATQMLERDTKIAVVAVGYADGYPRAGSGAGVPLRDALPDGQSGFIAGHRVPLIGRITMDLTLFDITDVPDAALEDGWIELIGPNIPLDEAAKAAGTIGYELLTSVGPRYERRYLNAFES